MCHRGFTGAKQGENVPRKSWMDGTKTGLLEGRAIYFKSEYEDESRRAEMFACELCDSVGIARMNPKKMDGKETKMQTSSFIACIEVLRKGPFAPNLQVNEKRLQQDGGEVSLTKCGNSTSAPYLIQQDTRLRAMVGLSPLPSYLPYLGLLQSHSATQDAGILSLSAIPISCDAPWRDKN